MSGLSSSHASLAAAGGQGAAAGVQAGTPPAAVQALRADAQQEFLQSWGHASRNFLGNIGAAAEVLRGGAGGEAMGRRAVALLVRQSQKFVDTQQALEDMAAIAMGCARMQPQLLSLARLQEALGAIDGLRMAPAGGADGVGRAAAWIRADLLRLQQTVASLAHQLGWRGGPVDARCDVLEERWVLRLRAAPAASGAADAPLASEAGAASPATLLWRLGPALVRYLAYQNGASLHAWQGAPPAAFVLSWPLVRGIRGPGAFAPAASQQAGSPAPGPSSSMA